MKPSNPGEKSFLSTKKKGNVIINPKKEDLMKETKLQEKKAAKDYDGDGKIESGTDEYMGSRDKAIKKAMGKKHDCASKVKHEEYGIGNPVKGMHDLDESGYVVHYDVLFVLLPPAPHNMLITHMT